MGRFQRARPKGHLLAGGGHPPGRRPPGDVLVDRAHGAPQRRAAAGAQGQNGEGAFPQSRRQRARDRRMRRRRLLHDAPVPRSRSEPLVELGPGADDGDDQSPVHGLRNGDRHGPDHLRRPVRQRARGSEGGEWVLGASVHAEGSRQRGEHDVSLRQPDHVCAPASSDGTQYAAGGL